MRAGGSPPPRQDGRRAAAIRTEITQHQAKAV